MAIQMQILAAPPTRTPVTPPEQNLGRTYQKTSEQTLTITHSHTTAKVMHPATAKWYDRRDFVFIEFLVEDSKDVKVNFEKSKFGFSCLSGTDNMKHSNEIDLFDSIDQDGSKHKRTDRSILCCLRKAEAGKSWPRLTKDKAKASLFSTGLVLTSTTGKTGRMIQMKNWPTMIAFQR
ncbi:hypothetical protein ABG768_015942 [Culter alburnus]|uniref:Prostaglandin E synthase 3 n=1 Tax=Culter alburnus TaxID=194366 RepID=A0AAW1YYZ4_CULAL